MARTSQKVNKSETLTIRLDPKTRFILEYVSRLKGQTITMVVERAIVDAAAKETVQDDSGNYLTWHELWDVSDGARSLNLARRKEFFPTFEEEKRLAFCKEHWPFFFINAHKKFYHYPYLNVLWPRVDEFISVHEQTASGGNYWAAGLAMRDALNAAGIAPPDWPINDNDIPF